MDITKIRHSSSKFVLATFISSMLLVGCSDSGDSEEIQRSADSHIKNANAFLEQGQYRAAILEAKNAAQRLPSVNTISLLAEVYMELGQYKGAQGVLEANIENHPGLNLKLAETYVKLNKFHSADAILSEIKPTEESRKDYDLLSAQIKAGLGSESEAFSALQSLAKKYPNEKDVRLAQFLSVFKSGTPKESEQTLAKLVADFPNDPEVLLTSAKVRFLQKNYPDTEKQLMAALNNTPKTDVLNPLRGGILNMLSKTLTQQGRYTEAAPYSKILKDSNPEADDIQNRLDKAFKSLQDGNVGNGEELLVQLNKEFPNLTAAQALQGLVKLEQGDFEKASEFFDTSVDPETASPKLSAAAAFASLRIDQKNKAIEILETALKSNPESAQLQTLYGLSTYSEPQYGKRAAEAFEKAISLGASDYRVYSLLAGYYAQTDEVKARNVIDRASETFSDVENQLRIYGSYINLGMDKSASSYAKKIQSSESNSAAGWIMSSIGEIRKENTQGAKRALKKALKVDSKSDKAWFLLGNSELALKNYDASIKAFKKAIKLNPDVGYYMRGLYLAESSKGSGWAAIEKSMIGAANNESDKVQVLGFLAQRATAAGQFSESDSFIEKFKASTESSPVRIQELEVQSALAKAQVAEEASNKPEVTKILESTLKKYPDSMTLLVRLGSFYLQEGDIENAEKIKVSLQGQKDKVMASLFEADILEMKGEHKSAVDLLSSHWVVDKDGRLGNAIYALSNKNNLPLPASFFAEWQKAEPGNSRPFLLEAMVAQAADKDNAVSLYEKIIEMDANNVPALNNLAWLYQEANQLDKADQLASRAVALAPESPSVLDTAGYIKMKMGDKKAIALLDKARNLAPDVAEIEEHYQQAKRSL